MICSRAETQHACNNTNNTATLNRLKQHIWNLSHAFVDTINAREWDSPLWDNVATNFVTKPEALSGGRDCLNGKDAFIESMKNLAEHCPQWRINIQTMTVNIESSTTAEVFTHSLATGEPVGIARPAMTRLEYKLIKNKWWFVSHEILPGAGGDMLGLQDPREEQQGRNPVGGWEHMRRDT